MVMMETGNLKSRAALKRNTKGLKVCEQGILLFCHPKDVWDNSKTILNSLQIKYAESVGENKSVSPFPWRGKEKGKYYLPALGEPRKLGLSF